MGELGGLEEGGWDVGRDVGAEDGAAVVGLVDGG